MQDSQNPAKCLLWIGQVLPFSSNCIWSSEDNIVRKNPWLFFAISVSIGLFGHKEERLALVNLSQIKKKKKSSSYVGKLWEGHQVKQICESSFWKE